MYAISFDMSVANLKQHYGEPYNNAYFEIGKELRNFEFYNTQGSLYLTENRGRVSIFHKCYSKPYLFSLSNFAPDSFVDPSPLRYT